MFCEFNYVAVGIRYQECFVKPELSRTSSYPLRLSCSKFRLVISDVKCFERFIDVAALVSPGWCPR
jgi:hypothetical protein